MLQGKLLKKVPTAEGPVAFGPTLSAVALAPARANVLFLRPTFLPSELLFIPQDAAQARLLQEVFPASFPQRQEQSSRADLSLSPDRADTPNLVLVSPSSWLVSSQEAWMVGYLQSDW